MGPTKLKVFGSEYKEPERFIFTEVKIIKTTKKNSQTGAKFDNYFGIIELNGETTYLGFKSDNAKDLQPGSLYNFTASIKKSLEVYTDKKGNQQEKDKYWIFNIRDIKAVK